VNVPRARSRLPKVVVPGSRLIGRRRFLRNGVLLSAGLPLAIRQYCRSGSLTGTEYAAGRHHRLDYRYGRALFDPSRLEPFVDPLPVMSTAQPSGFGPAPDGSSDRVPQYRVTMSEFDARMHSDLPPTRVWGYNQSMPGPTFEVRSHQGILVEWKSALPAKHFLPIDHTIHGAERDKPEVRNVVHLHGAKVPPESDGYPEHWFTPGHSATYFYPNRQRAATLWYHDHALGITRLNNFAGLAGVYVIHDEFEAGLGLPSGKFDLPLVLQDRSFDPDGRLNYPVSGDPEAPHIAEFFGNAVLVNGKVFPFLEVEPRKYRFRILNASNARFYGMTLSSGQPFIQIGTDQGLAPAPAPVDYLLLVPSERADVVIDFSAQAGRSIVLNNDAPSPYPIGGMFVPPQIMQFRVMSNASSKDTTVVPATLLPYQPISQSSAVRTRELVLAEYDDALGDTIIDLLGNANWDDPVTENPVLDTVEIWDLINTTDDAHPIHIHLIAFQIIERRGFDAEYFLRSGRLIHAGAPRPPAPNEVGWKDVVNAPPGAVTRLIARFEGYSGRYVWHCHILEHEDNEMMRPYDVLPAKPLSSNDPAQPPGPSRGILALRR